MNEFRIAPIPRLSACPSLNHFTETEAQAASVYHSSFPDYAPTPLHALPALASFLGVGSIHVKDESHRFGLNAFKALGGSYAIGRYLANRLGIPAEKMTFDLLTAPETRARLGEITFCTATDGNHGRGVAWTARRLGQKCVVYMPKGSAAERVQNIRALGAEVIVTDVNYDDSVRLARSAAEQNGWVVVQDTAWEGCSEIPLNVMQGYMTMALEAFRQLNGIAPTHIFLQAGVGSMAAAVSALFRHMTSPDGPTVVLVEPGTADCHYRSAAAGDGSVQVTPGDLETIMAGLACGEPNPQAWDILRSTAHYALTVPEYAAADGMRVLSNPLSGDERIISGESGAAGFGAFYEIMTKGALSPIRRTLGLNRGSRILFFSTEGATDMENFRKIVWEGAYAAPAEENADANR